MKTANVIALLVKNLVAVTVQYKDHEGQPIGKHYTYLSTDESIVEGDNVIVDAPSTGMTVVVVTKVSRAVDLKDHIDYKWVVQKVDASEHDERLAKLKEAEEEFAVLEATARQRSLITELCETLGDDAAAKLEKMLEAINK